MNTCVYNDDDTPLERELRSFRKLYNAALFNEWYSQGKYQAHKSRRHHTWDLCFGGDMFIVCAMIPTGPISNHYYIKDWDLFQIPEVGTAFFQWDGHSSQTVIHRLTMFVSITEESGGKAENRRK